VSGDVQGYCPMGCGRTLFLGEGGHITCSWAMCPDPSAVDELLNDRETEHIVRLWDDTFSVVHPLRERLNDGIINCQLHDFLAQQDGPPYEPGRYRVPEPWGDSAWESIP
jgi:hypothetical protein